MCVEEEVGGRRPCAAIVRRILLHQQACAIDASVRSIVHGTFVALQVLHWHRCDSRVSRGPSRAVVRCRIGEEQPIDSSGAVGQWSGPSWDWNQADDHNLQRPAHKTKNRSILDPRPRQSAADMTAGAHNSGCENQC